MKRRPTSVTVIAWILLVTSALSLLGSIMALNNPMAQEMMAKSPIPIPLQYVILYVGLAIEILCAIFMLQAANWARLLYIGWSGIELLILLLTSPAKPMLIPGILMYAIFVFFLLRPDASAYFTTPPMSKTSKNVLGIFTLVLSAFFYLVRPINRFTNQS
jgi:hypothetical protein